MAIMPLFITGLNLMATSKTPTTFNTTSERKAADGFVNISNPALGNIAIDFKDSEKATKIWEAVRGFSSEDQKTFIVNLILNSDVSLWIRHMDEGTKSDNADNALQLALDAMKAA